MTVSISKQKIKNNLNSSSDIEATKGFSVATQPLQYFFCFSCMPRILPQKQKFYITAPSYVSRGGSLSDRASVPGAIPGALGRLGSWIAVVEPGGAWERDLSFLSPSAWHTDGSLAAEPRPAGFPGGPVNHSPGLVRISCCFRQLLHTQIT